MFKKIPANAMYFAILISAIVMVLLSGFLLLVYLSQKTDSQANIINQNIEKVNRTFDKINSGSLSGGGNKKEVFWGAYNLLKVNSGPSAFDFQKIGLLGKKINPLEDPILYLQDKNMNLVLAGNSKLEGKLYIPGAFIKPGSINGNYFVGPRPKRSNVMESLQSLPELSPEWVNYLDSLRNSFPSARDKLMALSSYKNSFFTELVWIYTDTEIVLTEELTGNIIVKSSREIIVEPVAKLKDILLIAPRVIVSSGFKGSLHIISEEVTLESHSFLRFPSSISILDNEKVEDIRSRNFKVNLEADAKIHGSIIILSDDNQDEKRELLISNGSEVIGGIYNEGFTDLQGTIYGELYTGGFAAHSGGSVYVNHIFNGNIYGSPMGVITGIPLVKRDEIVAKWMY